MVNGEKPRGVAPLSPELLGLLPSPLLLLHLLLEAMRHNKFFCKGLNKSESDLRGGIHLLENRILKEWAFIGHFAQLD